MSIVTDLQRYSTSSKELKTSQENYLQQLKSETYEINKEESPENEFLRLENKYLTYKNEASNLIDILNDTNGMNSIFTNCRETITVLKTKMKEIYDKMNELKQVICLDQNELKKWQEEKENEMKRLNEKEMKQISIQNNQFNETNEIIEEMRKNIEQLKKSFGNPINKELLEQQKEYLKNELMKEMNENIEKYIEEKEIRKQKNFVGKEEWEKKIKSINENFKTIEQNQNYLNKKIMKINPLNEMKEKPNNQMSTNELNKRMNETQIPHENNNNNNSNRMKLFIKFQSQNPFTITVKSDDKIKTIKETIQKKEGFLITNQRLFYFGNELEDGKTLLDYTIQNESTLSLYVTLKL